MAYHLLFEYGDRLKPLQHFDVELSQVVVVQDGMDVSQWNKCRHSEVWRRETVS